MLGFLVITLHNNNMKPESMYIKQRFQKKPFGLNFCYVKEDIYTNNPYYTMESVNQNTPSPWKIFKVESPPPNI